MASWAVVNARLADSVWDSVGHPVVHASIFLNSSSPIRLTVCFTSQFFQLSFSTFKGELFLQSYWDLAPAASDYAAYTRVSSERGRFWTCLERAWSLLDSPSSSSC